MPQRISNERREELIERNQPPSHECNCNYCDERKALLDLRDAREALTIAVKALEALSLGDYNYNKMARHALDRIKGIG